MPHLWVRSEQRANEERVGLTPEGAAALIQLGFRVSVERSTNRAIPIAKYEAVDGCEIVAENSWPDAPADAIIFGLKELPDDGTPLKHRHIMFGHAYKGQPAGATLLSRFVAGGGTLYDLEYLIDESGRRVAAFGYWAGFAGAALAVKCWAAQQNGLQLGAVTKSDSKASLLAELAREMPGGKKEAMEEDEDHRLAKRAKPEPKKTTTPRVLIIGALGRVGSGAAALCASLGIDQITRWDLAETASGGPFPELLEHDIFLNCILASPGCPVFVPSSAAAPTSRRKLSVIGDIACDPGSDYNPIQVYDQVTTWSQPALRVAEGGGGASGGLESGGGGGGGLPLDVIAIDNLPSMLPVESSIDYAAQLLPSLRTLGAVEAKTAAGAAGETTADGVWGRAAALFRKHVQALPAASKL